MVGFPNVAAVADAMVDGRGSYATWRKSPSQVTTAGVWFDFSMSPGNPVPQYYASAPLVGVPMARSTDGGINHGGPISPASKHLKSLTVLTANSVGLPMPLMLLDYLLYYPFIDEGSADPQTLDSTAGLPRYTDGEGVQAMAVSVAGRTGGQSFAITYTNSDGVAGRVSQIVVENTAAANGSIVTSPTATSSFGMRGPFIPLQQGDTGIRSIDSVQMISGVDVGLFTLVLVKPIAQAVILESTAPCEMDYLTDYGQLPVIVDDAYLNLIGVPSGTLAATALHGDITTVWST